MGNNPILLIDRFGLSPDTVYKAALEPLTVTPDEYNPGMASVGEQMKRVRRWKQLNNEPLQRINLDDKLYQTPNTYAQRLDEIFG